MSMQVSTSPAATGSSALISHGHWAYWHLTSMWAPASPWSYPFHSRAFSFPSQGRWSCSQIDWACHSFAWARWAAAGSSPFPDGTSPPAHPSSLERFLSSAHSSTGSSQGFFVFPWVAALFGGNYRRYELFKLLHSLGSDCGDGIHWPHFYSFAQAMTFTRMEMHYWYLYFDTETASPSARHFHSSTSNWALHSAAVSSRIFESSTANSLRLA